MDFERLGIDIGNVESNKKRLSSIYDATWTTW